MEFKLYHSARELIYYKVAFWQIPKW
jgi:hypothetical protein